MPPLPTIADVIRVNIVQTDITGLQLGNRLFWRYSGTVPLSPACATIATDILAQVASHLVPLMASGDMDHTVTVTDLSSTSPGEGEASGSTTSSRSGGALPIGSAALMNYTISQKYRGGKPRTYWQWGTSADLSTQAEWGGSFITEVETAYAAFTSAVNAITASGTSLVNQCTVSYYDGVITTTPPWRGPGFKYPRAVRATPLRYDYTGNSLNPKLGSQRRRYQR